MQNRTSIFCTGWKPFSGWVLGIALLYHFIIYHTLCWVWSLLVAFKTISESSIFPQPFETSQLMVIISGLTMLGGIRSYDKVKNVQTDSIK
jgi:hypothetical protein